MKTFLEVVKTRTSINYFDQSFSLQKQDIEELVQIAQEAPSSFNVQNWRMIAVADQAQKEKLREAAFGQPKVSEAAVTIVVVGQPEGYREIANRWAPMVAANLAGQEIADYMQNMSNQLYGDSERTARDEAIRSASFAAMILMLAASDRGLASGALIGFDPGKVSEVVGLPADEFPVMLVAIGKETSGNWPRKPRRPLSEQLSFA